MFTFCHVSRVHNMLDNVLWDTSEHHWWVFSHHGSVYIIYIPSQLSCEAFATNYSTLPFRMLRNSCQSLSAPVLLYPDDAWTPLPFINLNNHAECNHCWLCSPVGLLPFYKSDCSLAIDVLVVLYVVLPLVCCYCYLLKTYRNKKALSFRSADSFKAYSVD